MNRATLAIILLLALAVLAGCAKEQVIVTQTTTKYATLDDTWIADCPTVAPPDPEVQAKLDLQHQLDEWAKVYGSQVSENVKCNIRYGQARDYNQKKRIESTTVTCQEGKCK